MLAFDEPVALPNGAAAMEGAHVVGSDVVAWCSNVTAKRRSAAGAGDPAPGSRGGECWVVHSTPTYARDNKCPQEAVPADVAAKVKKEMLDAFERAAGLEPGTLRPAEARVQLWGAANPLTAANVPAVFDSETRTGACGDWCLGPPCIEAAAESALALADAVEGVFGRTPRAPPEAAAAGGARVKWSPCAGTGALGGFPGTEHRRCRSPRRGRRRPGEGQGPGRGLGSGAERGRKRGARGGTEAAEDGGGGGRGLRGDRGAAAAAVKGIGGFGVRGGVRARGDGDGVRQRSVRDKDDEKPDSRSAPDRIHQRS